MPKTFTVVLRAPSGSRTGPLKDWLNGQLSAHRMEVLHLEEREEPTEKADLDDR